MIKELFEGLKSKVKGSGDKNRDLSLEMPPSPLAPPPQPTTPFGKPGAGPAMPQPAPTPAPATPDKVPDDFSALIGGATNELDEKVKAIEEKTAKLESTINQSLDLTKQNKTRLDSIDDSMKKFLSLYELVTNQINPFVDTGEAMAKMPTLEDAKEKDEKITVPQPDEDIFKPVEEEEEKPAKKKGKSQDEGMMKITPLDKEHLPDEGEKVMFLQSIKDGNASFVMEWITSLVSEDGGVDKNTKLLKYLLDMGWITPKAYDALMSHLNTIAKSGKIDPKDQKIPFSLMTAKAASETAEKDGSKTVQQLPTGEDSESLKTLLDWIKSLVDEVGYDQSADILRYIVQLGWITPDAHMALLNYIAKTPTVRSTTIDGQKAVFPQMTGGENKIILSPTNIPSPADFMKNKRGEYIMQEPVFQKKPAETVKAETWQPPKKQDEPQDKAKGKPAKEDERPAAETAAKAKPTDAGTEDIIPLNEIRGDAESQAIALEWIRYFVDKAGTANAKKTFNHYLKIGWVNDSVHKRLLRYMDGLKAKKGKKKKYKPTVEDQAVSLFFISKLKKMELSEGEIKSMLKKQ